MSEPPASSDETPDPWAPPTAGLQGGGTPPVPGWGNPAPPQPGWGNPPPPQPGWGAGNNPNPYGRPTWGYTLPPGWTPRPVKPIRAVPVIGGIAACFLLNLAAISTAGNFNGGWGALVILVLNVSVIVLAAVKGYKSFAVGFALGYVVALVLVIGACFLFFINLEGNV